jgi:hypothetical protein
MVTVIAVYNLSEPCTDVGNRLVHAAAQFCFNPEISQGIGTKRQIEVEKGRFLGHNCGV